MWSIHVAPTGLLQAVKQGTNDSKDACWAQFVLQCRNNLHVVLAMSPVGETLRTRCRNFPGLVNSTVIDWFEPWPEQALHSVASVFLQVTVNLDTVFIAVYALSIAHASALSIPHTCALPILYLCIVHSQDCALSIPTLLHPACRHLLLFLAQLCAS